MTDCHMPKCHAPGVCKFEGTDNDERIAHLSLCSGHFDEVARVTGYYDDCRPNSAEAIRAVFHRLSIKQAMRRR